MVLTPATNAREQMPSITAFIDDLRTEYGKEQIDQSVRSGLRNGTFWAIENGYYVGYPPSDRVLEVPDEDIQEIEHVDTDIPDQQPLEIEA